MISTLDHISFSAIYEWLRCQYAWRTRYILNLDPARPADLLSVGGLGHEALAAFLRGSDMAAWWQTTETETGDALDLEAPIRAEARRLYGRAVEYSPLLRDYEPLPLPDGTPAVEMKVTGHARGPVIGFVDAVMRHRQSGGVFVADHKFRENLGTGDELNLQLAMYQYMLARWHGIGAIGTIKHEISSEAPGRPELKKDGSMSRAAIRTDWPTYRAALLDARLNPDDYADMKEKLEAREMVRLHISYHSMTELENIWRCVVEPSARQMLNPRRRHFARSLGPRACNGCWCRSLCFAELRGDDVDYIIETQFQPRKPRHENNETRKEETENGDIQRQPAEV